MMVDVDAAGLAGSRLHGRQDPLRAGGRGKPQRCQRAGQERRRSSHRSAVHQRPPCGTVGSSGSSLTIDAPWLLPTQKVTGVVELSTNTRRTLVCRGSRYSMNWPVVGIQAQDAVVVLAAGPDVAVLVDGDVVGPRARRRRAPIPGTSPVRVSNIPIRSARFSPNQRRSCASIMPRRGPDPASASCRSSIVAGLRVDPADFLGAHHAGSIRCSASRESRRRRWGAGSCTARTPRTCRSRRRAAGRCRCPASCSQTLPSTWCRSGLT